MSRKTLKETLKRCAEYRKSKNKSLELAEQLVELAQIYQEKQTAEDRESAISAATEAVEVVRHEEGNVRNNKIISFAYRILSESYAEQDNRHMALKSTEKFRKTALASTNHSQIQLSFHVSAWVLEKLWCFDEPDDKTDLVQAYKYAQKSLEYLEKFSSEIKQDREAVEKGDTPEFRKANLERFLAGLAGNLGRRTEAERYFRNAMEFARRKNLSDLKYELQVTQLDFPWIDKKKMAQILVNDAPSKKKGAAKLEQSQILILDGDMERAFRVLLDIKAHTELHEEDKQLLNTRLVFVYKFNEAFRLLKNDSLPAKEKRKIYEKLGDMILQFSSTNKEALQQGVKYYNKMLLYSTTDKEKVPALISLGTTFSDLKQYAEALRNYKDCLECETRIGKSFLKTISTRTLIFNATCKGRLLSKEELEINLNELLTSIPQGKRLIKRDLCKLMAEYLASVNDHKKAFYEQEAKKYQGNRGENSSEELTSDEETEHASGLSKGYEKSDIEILKECERKAKSINDSETIEKRKNWKNSHGETELHLEAKGDNIERLKKLLNFKYPINAQDNSGWTALHEAINHKKIDNVKLLLNYGARLDIASNEGTDGGLDEGRIGGKITPLMDACANFTEGIEMITIAEMLFRKCPQTVTCQNEDGWTSADFTIDSIKKLEAEREFQSIPRANALLKAMEKEFQTQNIPFRWTPPAVKARANSVQTRSKKTTEMPKTGVSEYQNAMQKIGRRSRCTEVEAANIDIDAEMLDSSHQSECYADFNEDCFDEIPIENIRPTSQQSFSKTYKTQLSSSRRKKESDDFIINDLAEPTRKRKKRENATQAPRKTQENCNYMASENEDFFEDVVEMPVIKTRKLPRFNSTEEIERLPQASLTPPLIPSTSTLAIEKLSISISFADSSGKQIRNNLITAVESTASVQTIYEKCAKTVVGNQHNLTICLEDGSEVDSDMPLSLLRDPDSGFVKLKCVTERASAQTFFQSYNQEFKDEKEIIEKLRNFSLSDTSSEVDFSKLEADYCIDAILRSLIESGKPIQKINLTYCDLGNVEGDTLRTILDKCQEFKACSSNFSNTICQQIIQPGINFTNLSYLDISFNRVDGNTLSNFITLCPSLSKVIAKGLDLRNGSNQFAEAITSLSNLTHLSLQNSFISNAALEQIIASSNSLLYLDIGSAELTFTFSPCWLPALRELRMAACSVHSWESFLDWISLGAVEKLDLSCTSFTTDHILSLCERKVDTTTNIVIRLMKCPHVEYEIENLKEEILRLLENRTCPIRMQLPTEITRDLRLQTTLTEQFLID